MKISVNKVARKVEVDNRIPLYYYYRIADNLLRQASIYREEKNVVDLYIILLRFSSLVSETIPFHRDYQALHPKERTSFRKRLLAVLDELEFLKPEFQRRVDELNEEYKKPGAGELDAQNSSLYSVHGPSSSSAFLDRPSQIGKSYSGNNDKMSASVAPDSLWKYDSSSTQGFSSNYSQIDQQFNKISISLPHPKQETLSRHSFLGPSGLSPQWRVPSAEIKVQYPSSTSLISAEDSSLNQARQNGVMTVKDGGSWGVGSTMDSVLSLDDGRWSREDILSTEVREDPFQFVGVHQPSPPPVLARIQQEIAAIPPSKVADPRPGPAKPSQDGIQSSTAYQHLHVPVNLMEEFLRLARANTQRNLETCAVLAGSLKNRVFHITTLIVPKQESTSDSCSTLNEEEIFEVQDKFSLFPLGWIHTHPTQTCFMSSVDLHTHYSYQIMLPEAVAIVMAPTDASSPHGIFHLSDPGGVSIIRNCQQRGFHPHEEPLDGSPIYEHCSHVYMNAKLKFDVVDLREL